MPDFLPLATFERFAAWIILGVVAAIAFVVTVFLRASRNAKVTGKLEELGLVEVDPDEYDLIKEIQSIAFFDRGVKNSFDSVYKGTVEGLEIAVFEYGYCKMESQGSMDEEETWYEQTLLAVRSDDFEFGPIIEKTGSGFHSLAKGHCVVFFQEGKVQPVKEYDAFLKRCLRALETFKKKHAA